MSLNNSRIIQVANLFCILLIALCIPAFAQAPDTIWTKTFGGAQMDVGRCVQETSDNGFIVSAHTRSFGAGWHDYYLIKTNSTGDSTWTRTYGGAQNDFSRTVEQTADGGYIITGATLSFGAGNFDVYLVKTNANGDTMWTRAHGGLYNDWGYSIQQTFDGGYIVCGSTGENTDLLLFKTTANGDTSWVKTYGGSYADAANSVQQTPDSGYIVVGYTESFGTGGGNSDIWLLKTNANGDTAWTRTYAIGDDDEGSWIQLTSDGGYIIAGAAGSSSSHDAYVLKTDANGDTAWTQACGGANDDWAYSVHPTVDNGYVCAGYTFISGTNSDFYIFKLNSNGGLVWTKTLGAAAPDIGVFIQQTADSGYIATGYTQTYGAGNYDVWLVKLASESSVTEVTTHPAEGRITISPNPFRDNAVIALKTADQSISESVGGVSAHQQSEIRIYDATGRLVKSFSLPTTYSQLPTVLWDGTDNSNRLLPPGIYFLKCTPGDRQELHKLVLVK